MKKLKVKKGSTCMACLACVGACSEAFYKVFDPDKACLQIVEKKAVRPIACPQCGKCAEACPEGAITQNPKGVYMINKKKCTGCGACAKATKERNERQEQTGRADLLAPIAPVPREVIVPIEPYTQRR